MDNTQPIYLNASTAQFFERPDLFGCMFSYRPIGGQPEALAAGCKWMLDNGEFAGRFVFQSWVLQLALMLPFHKTCLGIIVPDVPYHSEATLERFRQYYAVPAALGYPVAHATQDGMTPEAVPWSLLDVLFIGGSDKHKRGIEATRLALAARARGKWIHVGRVSGGEPIRQFWSWADSFDGTTFVRNGKTWSAADKMRTISAALEAVPEYDQWGML